MGNNNNMDTQNMLIQWCTQKLIFEGANCEGAKHERRKFFSLELPLGKN